LQASVAEKLCSSFTPRQEAADLLSQVYTSEPLLRVLIEKQIATLSAPIYESFEGRQPSSSQFMRYETTKTGQFHAAGNDGSHVAVLEFTVTGRCGMHDQTRRAFSQKSYGLKTGERVECLSRSQFQVADTGVLLQRI
jgi:hypothetical protein